MCRTGRMCRYGDCIALIQEIVLSIIAKKGKGSSYLSESSEESDSVKTIVIRENEAIPHKQ